MNVNQIYCGDDFTMYIDIEPCCMPATDKMLYVSYTSIKKQLLKKILKGTIA